MDSRAAISRIHLDSSARFCCLLPSSCIAVLCFACSLVRRRWRRRAWLHLPPPRWRHAEGDARLSGGRWRNLPRIGICDKHLSAVMDANPPRQTPLRRRVSEKATWLPAPLSHAHMRRRRFVRLHALWAKMGAAGRRHAYLRRFRIRYLRRMLLWIFWLLTMAMTREGLQARRLLYLLLPAGAARIGAVPAAFLYRAGAAAAAAPARRGKRGRGCLRRAGFCLRKSGIPLSAFWWTGSVSFLFSGA